MYRGLFRTLPRRSQHRFGSRLWGRGSLVDDGQGPAPARQFPSDSGVGHTGTLVTGLELVSAPVQAPVARVAAGPGLRRCEVPAVAHRLAGHLTVLVMPGRLDQQTAHMSVAGLGDRALEVPKEYSEGTRPT